MLSTPSPTDAPVVIPISWPVGTYALPKPEAGCPNRELGWREGDVFQDLEDTSPQSAVSAGHHFAGTPLTSGKNILMSYCVKTNRRVEYDEWKWPKGSYCIAKYGDCPSGEYITFDLTLLDCIFLNFFFYFSMNLLILFIINCRHMQYIFSEQLHLRYDRLPIDFWRPRTSCDQRQPPRMPKGLHNWSLITLQDTLHDATNFARHSGTCCTTERSRYLSKCRYCGWQWSLSVNKSHFLDCRTTAIGCIVSIWNWGYSKIAFSMNFIK